MITFVICEFREKNDFFNSSVIEVNKFLFLWRNIYFYVYVSCYIYVDDVKAYRESHDWKLKVWGFSLHLK